MILGLILGLTLLLPLLAVPSTLLPAARAVSVATAAGLHVQRRGKAEGGKYEGKGGKCEVHGGSHRHQEVLRLKA